jgi:hypothetical protein
MQGLFRRFLRVFSQKQLKNGVLPTNMRRKRTNCRRSGLVLLGRSIQRCGKFRRCRKSVIQNAKQKRTNGVDLVSGMALATGASPQKNRETPAASAVPLTEKTLSSRHWASCRWCHIWQRQPGHVSDGGRFSMLTVLTVQLRLPNHRSTGVKPAGSCWLAGGFFLVAKPPVPPA